MQLLKFSVLNIINLTKIVFISYYRRFKHYFMNFLNQVRGLIRFHNLIMNLNKVKLKFECITECKNECIITEISNYIIGPRLVTVGRFHSTSLEVTEGFVKRVLGHYMLGHSLGFQLLTLSMRQ